MPAFSLRSFQMVRDMRVTSTSAARARARKAPTVASSLAVCLNGSQSKKRHAFCQVILWISSSEQPASLHWRYWSIPKDFLRHLWLSLGSGTSC